LEYPFARNDPTHPLYEKFKKMNIDFVEDVQDGTKWLKWKDTLLGIFFFLLI